MPLNWLFGSREEKLEDDENEYIELDTVTSESTGKVKIRILTLNEFGDVEKAQNLLRDNNVVWIKIKPLKDKDMTDLKRAIDRLKKTVMAINGDIAGVDNDWIIATPSFARIHR